LFCTEPARFPAKIITITEKRSNIGFLMRGRIYFRQWLNFLADLADFDKAVGNTDVQDRFKIGDVISSGLALVQYYR
jgi:hypothetical protein